MHQRALAATGLVALVGAASLAAARPPVQKSAGGLVVHEWGTFTSVSGSDGQLLPGLQREEEALPIFVHSHEGMASEEQFAYAGKGYQRPLHNVTVKLETPVLYFYSPVALPVHVDVGFNGGSISQWFPDRS